MLASIIEQRAAQQSADDYARYRRRFTKRMQVLRKRGTKSSADLGVFDAERHWADARAFSLLAEAQFNTSSNGQTGSGGTKLKQRVRSKLAKAAKLAEGALKNAENSLEHEVYAQLIMGEFMSERRQFTKAADFYAKARLGVQFLAKQQPENSGVFQSLLAAAIDPSFRFALQRADGLAGAGVDLESASLSRAPEVAKKLKLDQTTSSSGTVNSVQFRQYTAKIQFSSVGNAVYNAQKGSDKVDLWESCVYEIERLESELEDENEEGVNGQDLAVVKTFAKFELLKSRILRDAEVAGQSTDPSNAARLYDAVLQSCSAMADLPGVYNDSELVEGIERMQAAYRSLRLLKLSATFEKGTPERLALAKHAFDVLPDGERTQPEELPMSAKGIALVSAEVSRAYVQAHALAVIRRRVEQRSSVLGSTSSDTAFEQLPASKPVADLRAEKLEPLAVKPVFYDVAYHCLVEAGETSEAKTEAKTEASKPEKGRGLFGLFK